jgi:hypothetical protein
MASNIATRYTKHRRSSPPKQCHVYSPDCMKPLPQLPTMLFPSTQRLPCGCEHLHVMDMNLGGVVKGYSAFTTTPPSTSTFPLAMKSPHQSHNAKSIQIQLIWPYSEKFYYHVPHISSRSNDFYTLQEDIAYDISSPHNTPKTLFDPQASEESLELPLIHEHDFQYYPISETGTPSMGSETESQPEKIPVMRDESKKKRQTEKKNWGSFWSERIALRRLRKLGLSSM